MKVPTILGYVATVITVDGRLMVFDGATLATEGELGRCVDVTPLWLVSSKTLAHMFAPAEVSLILATLDAGPVAA